MHKCLICAPPVCYNNYYIFLMLLYGKDYIGTVSTVSTVLAPPNTMNMVGNVVAERQSEFRVTLGVSMLRIDYN